MIFGQRILRSVSITLKHLLRRSVTVQYPEERLPIPECSRGALRQKGAIDISPFPPLSEKLPPCTATCPANVNAREYIGLISQKRYKDAYAVHLERNPFPATLGRICPHPCESACQRGEEDAPVTICSLKRFFADNVPQEEKMSFFKKPKERKGKKVAVVGSGPAGLTVAYHLGKCGYDVTIFERMPVAGGLLATALPTYRLPVPIIETEVKQILNLGAELRLNTVVGSEGYSLDDLFDQGYSAIFLGVGAHRPMRLKIEGEELEGVVPGEDFLIKCRLEGKSDVPERVAIIGGGNTAIDCARVSLRLGAKDVKVLYRRSRAEMPAAPTEVEDAIEEGVDFQFLVAPVRILGKEGKVKAIECIRMKLGLPDETGRRKPIPIAGSEFRVETDQVLLAIGRIPETEWLKENGVEISKKGTIVVEPSTGATSREGVYAGGDAVTGPSIVVEAIGTANRAAYAIDLKLNGGEPSSYWEDKFPQEEAVKYRYRGEECLRASPPKRGVKERVKSFVEVEMTFPKEVAFQQAERCLSCMTQRCIGCFLCEKICPSQAINISAFQNGERKIERYQIDYGRCQFCGLCVEVCPTLTLEHTPHYELAEYTRQLAIYDKGRILK